MRTFSDKKKLELELEKLNLELEKMRWEQEENTDKRFIAASDREKLRLESDKLDLEKKWHTPKTFVVPAASIIVSILVLISTCNFNESQKEAKNTELQLAKLGVEVRNNELILANKKAQDEFNDRRRIEWITAGQELDKFWQKNKNDLSQKPMNERESAADRVLLLFSSTSPDLVIDYFRNFRDEMPELPEPKAGGALKDCFGGELKKCENFEEYYKRAALMNHIRFKINGKITIYLYGNEPLQLDNAETILKGEGFAVIKLVEKSDSNGKPPSTEGEVGFFYEQDETFAETVENRLNDCLRNDNPPIKFQKIYYPESDYRNSRKIKVLINSIQLKPEPECRQ